MLKLENCTYAFDANPWLICCHPTPLTSRMLLNYVSHQLSNMASDPLSFLRWQAVVHEFIQFGN